MLVNKTLLLQKKKKNILFMGDFLKNLLQSVTSDEIFQELQNHYHEVWKVDKVLRISKLFLQGVTRWEK